VGLVNAAARAKLGFKLKHTQMTEKPMLRIEVNWYARALRAIEIGFTKGDVRSIVRGKNGHLRCRNLQGI
jgi:hypothetical protein